MLLHFLFQILIFESYLFSDNSTKTSPISIAKKTPEKPQLPPKSFPFHFSNTIYAELSQPRSLDSRPLERPSSTKRRGSRKSRSLRSTHLAMMSRPLVKSIAIDQDDDSSTASNSPAFKPEGENLRKFREINEL